jgi:large subunit ribosomal protein L19
MKLIEKIEGEQIKKHVPFRVGDSVKVHTRVREGEKERTQIFAGVIIAHKGAGLNESFTVRRISYGEGVERVFPINSPRIEKIEVEREGQVRRAKLFYLRGRKGKEALFVKERFKATVAKKEKGAARRAKAEKAKADREIAAKA